MVGGKTNCKQKGNSTNVISTENKQRKVSELFLGFELCAESPPAFYSLSFLFKFHFIIFLLNYHFLKSLLVNIHLPRKWHFLL